MERYPLVLLFLLIPLVLLLPAAAAAPVEITISREGFVPRELSVANGTAVVFYNQDSLPHWPASNPHPTHTEHPELDPKQPIAPGQTWRFIPKNNRRYRYHDHRLPHRQGEIVVGTPRERWERILRRLHRLRERLAVVLAQWTKTRETLPSAEQFRLMRETDQRSWLPKLAAALGVEKTWQFLLAVYQSQGSDNAHNIAHLFGRLLYQLKGGAGLTLCTPEFAFGCYHGFAEDALTENLAALTRLAQSCALVGRTGSGPWASCIHGLGHGVATATMTSGLTNSLAPCDTLMAGATFCHDGVLMEYAVSAPRHALGADDISTLCEQLPAPVRHPCGRNLPDLLTKWQAASPKTVANLCQGMKDYAVGEGCIDAIGLDVAQAIGSHPQKIASGCSVVTQPDLFARCITAAAGELVFQNIAGYQTAAKAVCRLLPPDDRERCEEKVSRLAADYGRPL